MGTGPAASRSHFLSPRDQVYLPVFLRLDLAANTEKREFEIADGASDTNRFLPCSGR